MTLPAAASWTSVLYIKWNACASSGGHPWPWPPSNVPRRQMADLHSLAITRSGSAPSASRRTQADVPVERRYLLPDPSAKSLHSRAVLPVLWIYQVVGASGS